MDLAQLKMKGGVVADALVPVKVEWKHLDDKGKPVTDKFTVHIRRHSFGVMEKMYAGGEVEQFRTARLLSASVMLGKDGSEDLPFEDAVNLEPSLGLVLYEAVKSVNNPPPKS